MAKKTFDLYPNATKGIQWSEYIFLHFGKFNAGKNRFSPPCTFGAWFGYASIKETWEIQCRQKQVFPLLYIRCLMRLCKHQGDFEIESGAVGAWLSNWLLLFGPGLGRCEITQQKGGCGSVHVSGHRFKLRNKKTNRLKNWKKTAKIKNSESYSCPEVK